jgi:hypothetical protein
MVEDFFERDGDGGRWIFSWRWNLFQWESGLLDQLMAILNPVNLLLVEDCWR